MADSSLALAPGICIDGLRIQQVLGQGAYAITYLVDDESLGRSFALKEYCPSDHVVRGQDNSLTPADDSPDFDFAAGLQRFMLEGRTVAPLDHPNIVKIFRCFEANGTAYLLMTWYLGEPLHKLLERSGALTGSEVEAVSLPLLDALSYLHQHQVIHQDIKPSNIYITESGTPILLDFGAAAIMHAAHQEGALRQGSEGYAAIEQSSADAAIGPWTDIYGFAATLYRCTTGHLPAPASERKKAHDDQTPDPLVAMSLLGATIQEPAIMQAIDHALALHAEDRPQTIDEWRSEFGFGINRNLRTGGTGSATPEVPEIEQEGREWLPIILISVFALMVVAMAVYLFTVDRGEGLDADLRAPTTDNDQARFMPEEKIRWEQALEADSAFGYRQFIEDFQHSIFRSQAEAQLDILDDRAWQVAIQDASKSAIKFYLEEFSEGNHIPEAMIILDRFAQAEAEAERERAAQLKRENLAWEAARQTRTVTALDNFLEKWPESQHADEARGLRGSLQNSANDLQAYQAARKLNTIEAYQQYIGAFPQGSKLASALEAIDSLTLRPGKTFHDCEECPTMMVVPAGSYSQGSDNQSPLAVAKEKPQRTVSFARPFAVSVFEITMAQWDQCAEDGGCKTTPRDNGWGRESHPAIMVSWNDAQEYVDWISRKTGQSYRLPSESEWEYVARAGEHSDWLGGDPTAVCAYGNIAGAETDFNWQHDDCSDNAVAETRPVGSYKANAFGLYDVIGNAAEWTLDCMNLSYLDAPADGSAWTRGMCSSRMTRGGSWFTGTREIRLPARFNLRAGDRNDFTGFRLVRTVKDQ